MKRKATIEELVRLYFEEGKSLKEISKIVDLTKSNIRNRLVAAGHTLRPSMRAGWANPNYAPKERPSLLDIAWVAGVYEGEGAVLLRTGSYGIGRPIVSVIQKDGWLCERLRCLFGGTVKRYARPNGRRYYYWRLTGVRGVGFLMTIYKFLSPRRKQQIREAFEKTGVIKMRATQEVAAEA